MASKPASWKHPLLKKITLSVFMGVSNWYAGTEQPSHGLWEHCLQGGRGHGSATGTKPRDRATSCRQTPGLPIANQGPHGLCRLPRTGGCMQTSRQPSVTVSTVSRTPAVRERPDWQHLVLKPGLSRGVPGPEEQDQRRCPCGPRGQ